MTDPACGDRQLQLMLGSCGSWILKFCKNGLSQRASMLAPICFLPLDERLALFTDLFFRAYSNMMFGKYVLHYRGPVGSRKCILKRFFLAAVQGFKTTVQ
ncbi:hypothetical protein SAY87_029337 [Trapa incisa]|uniref:Uncharacterized protein n=1 Tax=Trapa incisa TaxID=236973 RepID=A0AAN7KBH8_9MYRT|nr:hypothetical protein SAY87_029337 [Trapa incisa]